MFKGWKNKTESAFQEFQQLAEVDEVQEVDELDSCQSRVISEPEMRNDAKFQAGYLNTDCNFGEGEMNISDVKTNSINTRSLGHEAYMFPEYSFLLVLS